MFQIVQYMQTRWRREPKLGVKCNRWPAITLLPTSFVSHSEALHSRFFSTCRIDWAIDPNETRQTVNDYEAMRSLGQNSNLPFPKQMLLVPCPQQSPLSFIPIIIVYKRDTLLLTYYIDKSLQIAFHHAACAVTGKWVKMWLSLISSASSS
jgi:hypothetical protein